MIKNEPITNADESKATFAAIDLPQFCSQQNIYYPVRRTPPFSLCFSRQQRQYADNLRNSAAFVAISLNSNHRDPPPLGGLRALSQPKGLEAGGWA